MASQPVIGILSGLDQKSAAPFIDAFIKEYEKPFLTKGEVEIPEMRVYALRVTCIDKVPEDAEETKKELMRACQQLEKDGATCIVLTSYIAHQYIDELRSAVRIPLLDMVTLAMECIKKAPYKVALLGTRVTIATHIFQTALAGKKSEGVMPPYWQTHVDAMFKKIKVGLSAQTEFNWLLGRIKSSGITTVIVASTDLSKMASRATGFTMIDTNLLLAEAAVRLCR
ncbi:MAG: aspartate/glutamate racemase family protein [Candidatus Kerfeldbacteria bacterium]|nr:aspartate/glutamate racemase family protein [Candidatus Kerfeldbacteria bacterium]